MAVPAVNSNSNGQRAPSNRGESHRIYWQQWIANANSSTISVVDEQLSKQSLSRRELITSSAAVRISSSATIADITNLLRQTMELNNHDEKTTPNHDNDCIVLVGTLHSTSDRLVQFDDRFVEAAASADAAASEARTRTKPFHVVQTLRGEARPLKAWEEMLRYLESLLERDSASVATSKASSSSSSVIAPKLQFYYIPSPQLEAMPVLIPNCVELDGYATDIDDSDEEPGDDVNVIINNKEIKRENSKDADKEFRPIEAMFSWLVMGPEDNVDLDKTNRTKEHHSNLADELHRLSKSHSGFVLQCDRNDPNVWRTVWCALAADYLWTVSRVRKGGYPHIQRIHLSRALLLQPSSDYPPLFKTPYAWEIVAEDGTTHLFRASCRATQQVWIDAISEAIVAAYETSLLAQAETLIVDNCVARSKRCHRLAVDPIATANNGPMKHNVMLFGMAVSDYHECFRLDMATWDLAKSVRKQVDSLVEMYGKDRSRLRTLCNHLDFVMTGRQRSSELFGGTSSTMEIITSREGTPPKDLFDDLLLELQKLACLHS